MSHLREKMDTHHLGINDCYVSQEPLVIRTVLGSCVSVCLFDPYTKIGGMNHYMLPVSFPGQEDDVLRFGNTSIPLLIKQLRKKGAFRLRAKIFGGANIFSIYKDDGDSVSDANIKIARRILQEYGIDILNEDVGGRVSRVIQFHPYSGRVAVKRNLK